MRAILSIVLMFCILETAAAKSLPDFVFKPVKVSDKSSRDVKREVKAGAQRTHRQPVKARVHFTAALQKVQNGQKISEYEYIWTQYGLIKSSHYTNSSKFGPGTKEDYIKLSKNLLKFLDNQTARTGAWEFTELGAFRKEAYRVAGNGLVWYIYEDPKSSQAELENAVITIDRAIGHIRDERDHYIYDTKVRLLLRLKRTEEAYAIVKKIQAKDPGFKDFLDFNDNAEYQAWLKK